MNGFLNKKMVKACVVSVLICLILVAHGEAAVFYVDANGTNAMPPFADWSTAATNIQDAVDASAIGDLILVTNGIYQTGGRTADGAALTNRVVIDKAIRVQSINGPEVTIIEGYQVPGTTNTDSAVRCVYLTNSAVLVGFTLKGGGTVRSPFADKVKELSGGALWCESSNAIASNCVLIANAAYWYGGGGYSGTLVNCTIRSNTVVNGHGGGGGA